MTKILIAEDHPLTAKIIERHLLTARVSRADIVEGLNAGADDFITKPEENGHV
jgi:CheY-like chemotaxis protein